ncbi:uncharacterized protein DNG_06086 [Cephalotrichum gorgonifer]|uniref:Peptidase A1 domain-containing protein n=1 Tax=Cephalotrichum gorgonifer TaxID=2041049 RepID=A0AAE8SW75_9PEZI|nr:uncharacterized protein DNG_06086 [Cephalotrichum gorgonifer]
MKVELISDQALNQLEHLLQVGQDALNEVAQDRILRGIKSGFKDMSYRYQAIDPPFQETFEWIFDLDGQSPEATKFTQWLSSGDGVFHVCGKLGSGKSTLMKKLCVHERTRTELEKWMLVKGCQKLIMANFFFYALGSDPRQKSLMGLYRTLLHQILTASPGLAQSLLPDQWAKALSQPKIHSAYEILDDDIKQAYERLSRQHDSSSLGGYCFCFFIDGLDEYQTTTSVDRRDMVSSLADLANSTSGCFKICVSSRIENPFMDMFFEDTRLYLHKLTKPDMDVYVRGKLERVGTQNERQQLASSIIKKAEGVFLWVVLVVQEIRKQQLENGARFPRLLREIESLPTELDKLFQRILDTLGRVDRRLLGHTVSLLHFLGTIPRVKEMHLWLNLNDFYFLEDYVADPRFAQGAQFPNERSETVKESASRARRQLRGVCRGLVETDKTDALDFTHRSVGDFFNQEKVRFEMHDDSFNKLEALSQLKLANMKQYWWDSERQIDNRKDEEKEKKRRREVLNRHSILAACLVEQRRRHQLDAPPFDFLVSLDTIPQLSGSTTISRALACNKTAFHISLACGNYTGRRPYAHYEICHTSRVRHTVSDPLRKRKGEYCGGPQEEQSNFGSSAVLLRETDEEVDEIEEYSGAMISPLFTELCSGRLEYPFWRISHIHEIPLEPDILTMSAYYAIGAGIGRVFWERTFRNGADDHDPDEDALRAAGLFFLRHLFEQQVVFPNSLTHLAFGAEFGFIRIAAGSQQLSIWQHFLCWWATVAAASGDFESEGDTGPKCDSSNDPSEADSDWDYESLIDPIEQSQVGAVLETFIRNGADLQLALKIGDGAYVPTGADDLWVAYTLEIIPHGGEALQLDVVMNVLSRMELRRYPYALPHYRQLCYGETFAESPGTTTANMELLMLILQISAWIAAANALYIWEPCRVDGTCQSTEGQTIDSGASTRRSQPVTLEIHQRTEPLGRADEKRVSREAHRLSRKYGKHQGRGTTPAKTDVPVNVVNQYSIMVPTEPELPNAVGIYQDGNDYTYFLKAEIGSAKQPLYMLLDTGAGISFVMSSDCADKSCQMHDTWDHSTSSTYEDVEANFSVDYGSGTVKGPVGRDSVTLGNIDLTMRFGLATEASEDFKHFPFDGILGMSMARTKTNTDSFALAMKDSKALKSNVFSIYLNRGSSGNNNGELTLGGINDKKYKGDIGYTKVSNGGSGSWSIPLDDAGVGDKTAGINSRLAHIDTGTSYIFAPPQDAEALHKLIPGATSEDGVNWKLPCNTKEKVTFTFSGKTYAVAPKDYISASPGGGLCNSNIYGRGVVANNGWLLGDVFLKNVYAIFDMDEERIGFALIADIEGDTSDSELSTGYTGATTPPSSATPEAAPPGPESSTSGAAGSGEPKSTAESDDNGAERSGQPGVSTQRIPCGVVLALAAGVAAGGFLL